MGRVMAVPNGPHGSINRLVSDLGPEHYKTYQMSTPLGTHWRKATCEEVQCNMWVYGGVLTVDLSTELGQRQYHYATHDRMRSHSMQRVTQTLVKFVYGPGTICFEPVRSSHRIKMDRLPFYLVSGGDWRGNPRGTPRTIHRRPEDWVDDFATHQDKLAETAKRG